MSDLLRKIEDINRDAARELEKLSDSSIKSLSRDDLRDLFPGNDKFQMRRSIYEIIHKPEPIDAVFKELKGFVPHDSLCAAQKNDKVLDYLRMLKEIKAQVDNIQGFFQAHIENLEELNNAEPQEKRDKDLMSGASSSIQSDPMELEDNQTGGQSQRAHGFSSRTGSSGASGPVVSKSDRDGCYSQGTRGSRRGFPLSPQRVQVMYRSVVSGKTFNADLQLMTKVEQQCQDGVQLVKTTCDHKVTVLFCPISSRVGADVDAAMSDIEDDDKDIILVLMHHMREPKPTTNIRTWNDYKQVVLYVHVFYHETNHGLLTCQQNNDAVLKIQSELLNYSIPRFQATSGNAQGVGDGMGSTANRGGNNSSSGGGRSSWFSGLLSRS
ncbi:uncharacterized protein LOC119013071 [Acanthopagrus latus]|uniref:uncharacterized protein LOC119013071 n=1 Tax=Acanthopagrus latus TaxID=8177 RepID=UPI00187C95AB|nr:uncharacterized protein LOC119013071 [Acanthopagrus latus]